MGKGKMAASAGKLPMVHVAAGVVTVVLVVASLYWARPVLIPLALAILLTFVLNPIVSVLHRRGVGRTPAVLLVVVLAGMLLGGIGWTVVRQLTALADDLPRYTENLKQKITDLRGSSQGGLMGRVQTTVQEILEAVEAEGPRRGDGRSPMPGEEPVPVVVEGPSVLWQLPSVFEPLATASLALVLTIFMLLKHADLRARLISLTGWGRLIPATRALDEAGQRISRYLFMQSLINGSYGGALGLGLFLIGVPYAVLWGFLAAALRFIPYVGPAVGAVLPISLSLAAFEGWLQPLLVISLIAVLELISNMVMEPLLYGQSAGVSAVALLVAISFWTWLWGPVGLLLATPLTVCLAVLARHVPQLRVLATLLGDSPALEPATHYYQRLIARDAHEAAELIKVRLDTHSWETVFDVVLVPAVVAAKWDREAGKLTEEDVEFIIQTTRDIVDGLCVSQSKRSGAQDQDLTTVSDSGDAQAGTKVSLVLCPAEDELDELALWLFQHVLDVAQYDVELIRATLLTSERLTVIEDKAPQVAVIGALPPGGLPQTRYLCKRLRATSPQVRIAVGRWGSAAAREERRQLLESAAADEVAATLAASRTQVAQLSRLSPASGPEAAPSLLHREVPRPSS